MGLIFDGDEKLNDLWGEVIKGIIKGAKKQEGNEDIYVVQVSVAGTSFVEVSATDTKDAIQKAMAITVAPKDIQTGVVTMGVIDLCLKDIYWKWSDSWAHIYANQDTLTLDDMNNILDQLPRPCNEYFHWVKGYFTPTYDKAIHDGLRSKILDNVSEKEYSERYSKDKVIDIDKKIQAAVDNILKE